MADINDVAIGRLYKELRKRKLSQSTVRQVHSLLTSIFKLAAKRELILQNPMNKVDAPPKPKPVAMDATEVERFLRAASSRPEGFKITLAFQLGARPCEYLGLKAAKIFADKCVYL